MTDLARAMETLLARERASALRADVEDLELVQEDKRALLDRAAREGGFAPGVLEELGDRARANVGLIRQLVSLHRALAGLSPSGYRPDGRQRDTEPPLLSRRIV